MSRSDASITVRCDTCLQDTDPLTLTSLAGTAWDERNITAVLKRMGWREKDDTHTCDACLEDAQEDTDEHQAD